MRTPPGIVEPGKPVEVAAIVIADRPQVSLHYRQAGQQQWQTAAMANRFRRASAGIIPPRPSPGRASNTVWRFATRRVAPGRSSRPCGGRLVGQRPGLAGWHRFPEPAPAAAGQVKDLTAVAGDRLRGRLALDAACRLCRLPGHTESGRQGGRHHNYAIDGVHRPVSSPRRNAAVRSRGTGRAWQTRSGGSSPGRILRHSRRRRSRRY